MGLVFPLVGMHRLKKPFLTPKICSWSSGGAAQHQPPPGALQQQPQERGSLKPSLLHSISTSALHVFLLDTREQAGVCNFTSSICFFLPFTPEFLVLKAFSKAFWHAHPKRPPPNPLQLLPCFLRNSSAEGGRLCSASFPPPRGEIQLWL